MSLSHDFSSIICLSPTFDVSHVSPPGVRISLSSRSPAQGDSSSLTKSFRFWKRKLWRPHSGQGALKEVKLTFPNHSNDAESKKCFLFLQDTTSSCHQRRQAGAHSTPSKSLVLDIQMATSLHSAEPGGQSGRVHRHMARSNDHPPDIQGFPMLFQCFSNAFLPLFKLYYRAISSIVLQKSFNPKDHVPVATPKRDHCVN